MSFPENLQRDVDFIRLNPIDPPTMALVAWFNNSGGAVSNMEWNICSNLEGALPPKVNKSLAWRLFDLNQRILQFYDALAQDEEQLVTDRLHLAAAGGWLRLNDLQQAQSELDQVSEDPRIEAESLIIRGEIAIAAKNWVRAEEIARHLTTTEPFNSKAWILMGRFLHATNKTEVAWKTLKALVRRFHDYPDFLYDAARYACMCGDHDAAVVLLIQARIASWSPAELQRRAMSDHDFTQIWSRVRTWLFEN